MRMLNLENSSKSQPKNKVKMQSAKTTHIDKFWFCGLRRLNPFNTNENPEKIYQEWVRSRTEYKLGKINIIIGANGGGKSTVIDIFDSLRNPDKISTLGRENKKNNSLSAIDIVFTDKKRVAGTITSNEIEGKPGVRSKDFNLFSHEVQFINFIATINPTTKENIELELNIPKSELCEQDKNKIRSFFDRLQCSISFWEKSSSTAEDYAAALNDSPHVFNGILSKNSEIDEQLRELEGDIYQHKISNPVMKHDKDNKQISIYLSDDKTMANNIQISALPSGWTQLTALINWLSSLKNCVCLIEEPETNLHPDLQRHLIKKIEKLAEKNNLQLIIATHSPIFQQKTSWDTEFSIFTAETDSLVCQNDAWRALDILGVKGSDVSQSNGIIWVEGASDRIYIKKWIELFCKERSIPIPKENTDYSFVFYGGSSLSHMSLDDADSFISILKINRNSIVVMDRDLDFTFDSSGTPIKSTSKKIAKYKILDEVNKYAETRSYIWITKGYTIESYLPYKLKIQHFRTIKGRLLLKKGTKVDIANKFSNKYDTLKWASPDLLEEIKKLHNTIVAWNT